MPKLKIKEWKGIYTNLDENDQKLELSRESINWRHDRGFLQIEPRYLSEYTLPDLNIEFPSHNFEWETGIYCTLTNDFLNENPVGAKYDVLVLVAKHTTLVGIPTLYHRVVYLKDLTNNSPWYELSKNGNAGSQIKILNHTGNTSFGQSYFTGTKDGKAFFRTESGKLKLYLPHDCFWIGRLERTIKSIDPAHPDQVTIDGWYIDRLVEPFDISNLAVSYQGSQLNILPSNAVRTDITCGLERRLGAKFSVEVIESGFFNEEELTLTLPGTSETTIFHWFKYEFKNSAGEVYAPPALGVVPGVADEDQWYLVKAGQHLAPYYTDDILIVAEVLANELQPQGTTWDAIASQGNWAAHFAPNPGFYVPVEFANSWLIARTIFEAQTWLKTAGNTVSDAGWAVATDNEHYSILVTAVLDNREEIIIEKKDGKVTFAGAPPTNFALKVYDIFYPSDMNSRVTRIRFYHRFYNEEDISDSTSTDYVLHKEFDFIINEDSVIESFFMGEYTDTAITLSANINFYFEQGKPEQYKILTGFRDLITESGISIGLKQEDFTNVYHSSIGGGNLMPDLVYLQNILPVYGASIINAVATINKSFMVLSDNTTYMLKVSDQLGTLLFTLDATLEFGVKNPQDIVPIQGGLAINTIHGIYSTTGYQSTLISEPIDDIVKTYFITSRIYYNRYRHELYYQPTNAEDLYRFRFKDGVWEKLNKTTTPQMVEATSEIT